MNATVVIANITPAEAALMLEDSFDAQRSIRTHRVEELTAEMKAGTFKLSSDAILRIKGRLANGQHRLTAVVQSGKTQPFLLMDTTDESIFKVLDCGLKRTVGDALNLPNSLTLAASAKIILSYNNEEIYVMSGMTNSSVTRSSIVAFLARNAQVLENFYSLARPGYSKCRLFSLSSAIAFLYLASKVSVGCGAASKEFINQIYEGGPSCQGIPNDLRNRMISNMNSRAKLPSSYMLALTIKAFNATRSGKNLMRLTFAQGEGFPKIAG